MIRVETLTRRYGAATVLDAVDLELPDRGVTSVIGPNGAGKSTLLTLVGRLQRPDGGRVLLHPPGGDALDVHRAPSRQVARALAVLRQDGTVQVRVTVRELVCYGRFPHSGGRIGPDDRAAVDRALQHLELADLAERYVDELSGGQRQRALVAMVLAQETRHVLLDEPLSNLDPRHAVRMMQLLRRAADGLDRSVVLVVHDVTTAARWSDRIVAMRDGRVLAAGTPAEIVRPEVLEELYGTPVRVVEVDGAPVVAFPG